MAPGPDDTNPAIRAYAVPSCGACLRMAEKRGVLIGQQLVEGEILAITHADGEPQALAFSHDTGLFTPVSVFSIMARNL